MRAAMCVVAAAAAAVHVATPPEAIVVHTRAQ